MLVPAAAAQGFDQSLDGLVRQRVITSQERKLLRGGGAAVPIERSRFEEACRTGALSRQDCASGVARRPPGAPASARVRLIPSRQPLRVPVADACRAGLCSTGGDSGGGCALGTGLDSGLAGGYGVAIELEHAEPLRRYGHLSEIYVRPGQQVRRER